VRLGVRRLDRVHNIGAIGRVQLNAGVDALQPAIPPAQRFLHVVRGRADMGDMRILVTPRPGDAFHRSGKVSNELIHGVAVAIVVPADSQHCCLECVVTLTDGTMFPIGVAIGMPRPGDG